MVQVLPGKHDAGSMPRYEEKDAKRSTRVYTHSMAVFLTKVKPPVDSNKIKFIPSLNKMSAYLSSI